MKLMKHFDMGAIPEIEKPGIYAIHNIKADKYYIGSTSNLYYRFSLYFRDLNRGHGINSKMDKDIQSIYDLDNFEIIIIEMYEDNEIENIELRRREIKYISQYDSINNGYNTMSMPNPGNIPAKQKLCSKKYMTKQRRENNITFFISAKDKERYKSFAKSKGLSLNKLIVQLLEEDMKKSPT